MIYLLTCHSPIKSLGLFNYGRIPTSILWHERVKDEISVSKFPQETVSKWGLGVGVAWGVAHGGGSRGKLPLS